MGIITHRNSINNLNDYANDNTLIRNISDEEIVQGYFSNLHTLREQYYSNNLHNQDNISKSLIKKDFVTTLISPQFSSGTKAHHNTPKDWFQYLYYYLYKQSEKNLQWASDMIEELEHEYFLYENKYQSMFSFKELQIKTEPAILKQYEIDNSELNDDNQYNANDTDTDNNSNINPLLDTPLNKPLITSKNYGGSFISTMSQSPALFPEDPQNQYMHLRTRVKEYIEVFSQHIQFKDHPVHILAKVFCRTFTLYVNNELLELMQLKESHSSQYNESLFNKSLSITKQLQKFILKLQIILKLFYSQTLDYKCFNEEKDELVTCVTSLLFGDESLYNCVYQLFEMSEENLMMTLSDKYKALQNIRPESLGIDAKFCLNQSTIDYQKKFMIKKKITIKSKDKDKANIGKEAEGEGNGKESNKVDVNEGEKEINSIPSYKLNSFIEETLHINDDTNTKQNKAKEEHMISIDDEIILNNSKENKLMIELMNDSNIVSGFKPAIVKLESIKTYHTPFEKMVIIMKIGEKIAESVNMYWDDLDQYLSPGFLTIDADNLLSIFLYVIIKSKMSEIAIHSRIIKQFTTTTTKLSSIGYYYSIIDASINYIDETPKEELINKMFNQEAKE